MNIVLLYNNGIFASSVKNDYTSKVQVVTDDEAFDKFVFKEGQKIFILAELTWGNQKYSDFYGVQLIKKLRLERGILNSIILLSFCPKSFFLSQQNKDFQVLQTPGHHVLQLPIDFPTVLNSEFGELDELLLVDIKDHIFDLAGFIDELFHQLKNQILSVSKEEGVVLSRQIEEIIEHVFNVINLRITEVPSEELQLLRNALQDEIEKIINNKEPISKIFNALNTVIAQIKQLLPTQNSSMDSEDQMDSRWAALFVEDNPIISKQIQEGFEKRGIVCHVAENANTAYQILREDKNNLITALICDYRLLKPSGEWQEEQGYHILKRAFTQYSNFLAFFALTSFNPKALLKIRELHNMQMWSFSKEDIFHSNNSLNGFITKVQREAQDLFDVVISIPKTNKVWREGYPKKFDQPFSYYYRLHRLSEDFQEADRKIGNYAILFIKETMKLLNDESYIMQLPYVQGANTFQESIGKDKFESTSIEKLEKFRFKLMGRRIAMALFDRKALKKNQIYNVMKDSFLGRPSDTNNTINQFFTTYLGLSLEKDIPRRLLPEEKYWLVNAQLDYTQRKY